MAASYHADYATILADPADLPAVADALVANLAGRPGSAHGHGTPPVGRAWTCAAGVTTTRPCPSLEAAFRAAAPAHGWEVRRELEDVCPVVTLPAGGTWDDYLATLDKKARHEIRRKIRRAEAAGEVRFSLSPAERGDGRPVHRAPPGALGRRTGCSPTRRAASAPGASCTD